LARGADNEVGIVIDDQHGKHGAVHRTRARGDGPLSRFELNRGSGMGVGRRDPPRMSLTGR
jgi:hypothetical protein